MPPLIANTRSRFPVTYTSRGEVESGRGGTGAARTVAGIHLGWHYLYARHYDQAIVQFRKTLELDPAFPQAQRYAAWAYLQMGMHSEAIAALRSALNSVERDPEIEGELGHALAVAGRRAEALTIASTGAALQ
jgi:Tfp pilus assembly protein PilF